MVRSNINTVLLQQAGLVCLLASGCVRSDPCIAPVVGRAPRLGVQVDRAEIDVRQSKVGGEIKTLAELVRVRAIAGKTEAFVADGNHVVGVEGADVVRRAADPVRKD